MKHGSAQSLGLGLLLIALTIGAYLPAMTGGFLWDDDAYIRDCKELRTSAGLGVIWFEPGVTVQYYPLTFTVWWGLYQLWGLHTLPYHLVTLTLHIGVALLLWGVLRALKVPGAYLAGLIFALHPVHVMSVAWMTELKNTLSGVLYLGAVWAYVRFAGLGVYAPTAAAEGRVPPSRPARPRLFYFLALLLFLLAMLAKTAVSLLVVALLLIRWWQARRLSWRDLALLLPFALVTAVMGRLTMWVERVQGAAGAQYELPWLERILVAGRAFWFYLGKLLWPADLIFIYPRWDIDRHVGWQYLFPAALVLLGVALALARKRLGRGPLAAVLHSFVGNAGLVLIVVIFMTRYAWVSDHWQYLGSMSLIALAAALAGREMVAVVAWRRWAARGATAALVGALAVLTWQRCHIYRNLDTLWQDTLARNPGCAMAHQNLGVWLVQQGKAEAAVEEFRECLYCDPEFAEGWTDLGGAYLMLDDRVSAQHAFERAVALDPQQAGAQNCLGMILRWQGRPAEAQQRFRRAITLKPDAPEAYHNLGALLLAQGRPDAAAALLRRAVQLNPGFFLARYHLAEAYAALGRFAEAVREAEAALPLAETRGDQALAARLRERLPAYRAGKLP